VSNSEPSEWLAMTTDALLAQSAIDRLTSGAHTLIIEGSSHRQRQHVTVDETSKAQHAH
jgi:DNA replication protein DnaC